MPGQSSHPLFLSEDETGKRDISFIVVQRLRNGVWLTSPEPHTVNDLPNLAALQARYGGGKFRLFGRDHLSKKITARQDWDLPGEPLPFPGETVATPAAPVAAAPASSGDGQLVPLMLNLMMQNAREQQQQQQAASQAAQAQFQGFLALMMSQQQQAAAAAAAQTQAMMGLVTAVLSKDPSDTVLRGITTGLDLARTASGGDDGGDDGGDIVEALFTGAAKEALTDAMKSKGGAEGGGAAPNNPPTTEGKPT